MIDAEINSLNKRQYNTIVLAGIGIAVLFHPVVSYLLYTKSMLPLMRLFISRVAMWATLPLLYQYAHKVEDRTFLIWKEKAKGIYFYIASIAVLSLMIFFADSISKIPEKLGFHDDYYVLRYWDKLLKSNMPMTVLTCFTAGATEELINRGYIYPRLCLLFKSPVWPLIISSALFSLMHIGYGNLGEIIFTFIFGICCALFYRRFNNIQVLIIFHFMYDMIVTF